MAVRSQCNRISPAKFLIHPPIAFDLANGLNLVQKTMESEAGRTKALLAVARGTATGKTTAIEWLLREARLEWSDTLCLGITFSHQTPAYQDLTCNMGKLKDWPMAYAVGVVARMAVGVLDESLPNVYKALAKSRVNNLLRKKEGLPDAVETVASCVEYLLERTGKKFFLALDEALAAEEALLESFPPTGKLTKQWGLKARSTYDALQIVRDAVLASNTPPGALLVSSLERLALTTDSDRIVTPLPVPARLDPCDVLSQWWLVDCSEDESSYLEPTLLLAGLKPRRVIYKPANLASELRLLRLASLSNALPRGLEYMKEQLDKEMRAVPEGPNRLKLIDVDRGMAACIWDFARRSFASRPRAAVIDMIPSPMVMSSWLMREAVVVPEVSKFIRQSLFTNAVENADPLLLESCVLSLSAVKTNRGLGASAVVAEYIELLVNDLPAVCGTDDQAQQHYGEAVAEGTSLELVAMRVMQIKLAALVAYSGAKRSISIEDLFFPAWSKFAVGADQAQSSIVFSATVRLPKSGPFTVKEHVVHARLNKDATKFFHEVNAINLSKSCFKVLRAAAGDCFDVGLVFIDAETGNACVMLLDMKSAAVDGASLAALPLVGTFKEEKKEKAVKAGLEVIKVWWSNGGSKNLKMSPAGRALLDGRVLLSYLSTRQGPGKFVAGDSSHCDVTVVGRDVAKLFLTEAFFEYYALFRSVAKPSVKQDKR